MSVSGIWIRLFSHILSILSSYKTKNSFGVFIIVFHAYIASYLFKL